MLRNDEFEIVSTEMVVKREIKSGEQIDLSEHQYSIVIKGNIGEGATVKVAYNLRVEGDIGNKSSVSANQGFVIAKNIGDESKIKAGSRIEVATIGQGVSLEARDTIKTLDVGSNCELVSKLTVTTGNVGNNTIINARSRVISKDIGEHAKISSEKGEVYVDNISSFAEITALYNIHFLSTKSEKLTSQTGELMQRIDPCTNAYRVYRKPNPANTSSTQFQQASSNISVNVKNANLNTLSINVPLNLDFGKLSGSKAILFAVEKTPGENTFKIECDKDKTTYNVEKKTGPF